MIRPRGTVNNNQKSFDVSYVRYSPNRSSMKTDTKREGPRFTANSQIFERDGVVFDENQPTNQSDINHSNLFDKHILNIEKDIEQLAVIFHKKNLKEKAIKSFKMMKEINDQANVKADVNKLRNH